MKSKNISGQSLVEVIFAVLVLGLTLTGVVTLLSASFSRASKGYDRQKAADLARSVMEDLVAQKRSDPDGFWQLNDVTEANMDGFEGYFYSVDFEIVSDVPGCTAVGRECAEARVRVSMIDNDIPENRVELSRFFARNN